MMTTTTTRLLRIDTADDSQQDDELGDFHDDMMKEVECRNELWPFD